MSRASSSAIRCWSATSDEDAPRPSREPESAPRPPSGDAADGRIGPARSSQTSRGAIEDWLGTELENVFPDDGGRAAPRRAKRRRRPIRNGSGVGSGGARGRRLQSRSLRLGRDHARRSSRRAAGAGDHRSGAPHDRPVSDRSGRRGRLSRPAISQPSPRSSARRWPKSKPCWRSCRRFDPPGVCARNLTECLAIQLKERDRFDPAMQALVAASRSAGQARSCRRCAGSAASTTKISPT